MEITKITLEFLSVLLWPTAFIVFIIIFRSPLRQLVSNIATGLRSAKNIRLKVGGVQVESDILRKAENRMEEIAKENDLEKRLELAKQPLLADDAIRKISKNELKCLKKLCEERIDNALLLQYQRGDETNIEYKTFDKLAKLGLVESIPAYYFDDVGWLTPKGIEVLKKLNVESEPATMQGTRVEQGA